VSDQLQPYLEKWQLRSAVELVPKTYMGWVYKVESPQGPAVLKIYTEPGKYDGLHSIEALKRWNGNGAVQIYDHDPEAVLLEYAGNIDLMTLVKNGQDDKAAEITASVMQKLYAVEVNEPGLLIPLSERYRRLTDPLSADVPAVFRRSKAVAERLLAEQESPRVLHGDLHHGNILLSQSRGWIAIDPRGLYGDRASDAGGTLLSPGHIPEIVRNSTRLNRQASIMGEILGINPRKIMGYAYLEACVVSLWATEVGFDSFAAGALAMAELTEISYNQISKQSNSYGRNKVQLHP
jgi:streptomycin 6-kinase